MLVFRFFFSVLIGAGLIYASLQLRKAEEERNRVLEPDSHLHLLCPENWISDLLLATMEKRFSLAIQRTGYSGAVELDKWVSLSLKDFDLICTPSPITFSIHGLQRIPEHNLNPLITVLSSDFTEFSLNGRGLPFQWSIYGVMSPDKNNSDRSFADFQKDHAVFRPLRSGFHLLFLMESDGLYISGLSDQDQAYAAQIYITDFFQGIHQAPDAPNGLLSYGSWFSQSDLIQTSHFLSPKEGFLLIMRVISPTPSGLKKAGALRFIEALLSKDIQVSLSASNHQASTVESTSALTTLADHQKPNFLRSLPPSKIRQVNYDLEDVAAWENIVSRHAPQLTIVD